MGPERDHPGQYAFSEHYETEFDKFSANGVGLLGIVNYGNPLYDGGRTPTSPEALDAYGRYANAIAERFDVDALQVFNEFKHPGERFTDSGCGTEPHCYLPMIEAVERHVDGAHADIPIVVGATALVQADWFAGLWDTGAINHSDAMSFHPTTVDLPAS
ncbi:hypothetical protein ACFOEP_12720 [Microbacterium amylolyticum]|uniref:hypothetical protein n=1 Tax=Microbacterium amylolyticum TaxID=936337 RepID=UPI003608FCBE